MALAWGAAAWIAGIVVSAMFGAAAWPLGIAFAALLGMVALIRLDRRLAVYAIALPLLFVAGHARFSLDSDAIAANDVSHYNDGVAMRIRGEVRADSAVADTSQSFAISVREIQRGGEWEPASGGLQVRSGVLPRYLAGDIIELEGEFESPPNEAGFDYADYLAQRNIRSVTAFPAIAIVGHEDGNIVEEGLRSVRRHLSHGLAVTLPEPEASLAQGVLLGQRSALPPDLRDDLNATNTSHLVVVSGANVVLVSAFTVMALAWIVGRRRALWLSIAAIFAYMLLVGLSPPVVRGTIMGMLLVVAQVNGRRTNGIVSIVVAAAFMLAVDPDAVRDVSFQLSFAATAGIVFLAGPLHGWIVAGICVVMRRETIPSVISGLVVMPLATTVAAIVATEPLIALNFGRLSLLAVPANMLIVPAFPIILWSSLVASIGGLVPGAHLIGAAPAHFALAYWIAVTTWLADLPAASISTGAYTSWWAGTTYVAISAVAFLFLRFAAAPSGRRLAPGVDTGTFTPVAAVVVPVAVLIATAGFVLRPDGPARLEVTVLDVGQGDAILIETPNGTDILVDGGPGRAVLRGLGDELAWHDRSIELMILTHPQADHFTGLLDVLDRYDVRRVVAGPGEEQSLGYATWQSAVEAEGAEIEVPLVGTTFDLGDAVQLEVLAPLSDMPTDAELNNTSLVLRLVWGDVSFLLTGDIEAAAERSLVESGIDLRSTVFKVPHHGSRTSSSEAFLDAVRPAIAVVSAGSSNSFGHPAEDVVDRLRKVGPVLTTSEVGAARFETDGKRLWVSTDR